MIPLPNDNIYSDPQITWADEPKILIANNICTHVWIMEAALEKQWFPELLMALGKT